METITRSYTVYDYTELSEAAKEAVKQWYIDDESRCEIFTEDIENMLSDDFKNSTLKVQYSLAYCQGDGLNIYGELNLADMIEKISFDNFTAKEKRFILWAVKNYNQDIKIPYNNHYGYCIARQADFRWSIEYDMEADKIRDINYKALEKFEVACIEYLENLCSEYERAGYAYFYDPDESEISDACEANDWKFTADGKFFC